MKYQHEIKRYAKMFLNAVGSDDAQTAIEELSTIRNLIEMSREFRMLLENPLFLKEDREQIIRELSKRMSLSDAAVRFILYLSAERKMTVFPEIVKTIVAMYLEKKKRTKATVIVPVDTDRRYDERLKISLRKLTGRDADIEYIVDPSLIGGMIVKVGSTMYDSSIRGQLRLLKDDLIKG